MMVAVDPCGTTGLAARRAVTGMTLCWACVAAMPEFPATVLATGDCSYVAPLVLHLSMSPEAHPRDQLTANGMRAIVAQ